MSVGRLKSLGMYTEEDHPMPYDQNTLKAIVATGKLA